MEKIEEKNFSIQKRASYISLGVSLLILILKSVAYSYTHSAAILSDALESIVNVAAAAVAVIVIQVSLQPKDKNHPYGHGKIEYFSAAFEGGFILFASLAIFVESIKALLNQQVPHQLENGFLLMIGSGLINLFLGVYLLNTGKKSNSTALLASGKHVLTDFWTTFAVLISLILVMFTHLAWIDQVVGVLMSFHLAYTGYHILRESFAGLMDETDPPSLEKLAQALQKNQISGFIDIHELKVLRAGAFHHVDAHLVIPEFWDIAHAHNWSDDLADHIVAAYPYDGEFAFHLDPCHRAYCDVCDISDCPIRRAEFKKIKDISVDSMTGGPAPTLERI